MLSKKNIYLLFSDETLIITINTQIGSTLSVRQYKKTLKDKYE